VKVNVGCGEYPLIGFTNIDVDPDAYADLYIEVPPLPFEDGEVDEIYAGHYLEHLTHEDAMEFLQECHRCLVPGGLLGVVVPDTREVFKRYLTGAQDAIEYPQRVWWDVANLDAMCALILYSTVQGTPHRWMYDERTLAHALTASGFVDLKPIDRYRDPRIAQGAWYQFGYDCRKEGQ
jgi:predicted SAM-dependent methyltransferase